MEDTVERADQSMTETNIRQQLQVEQLTGELLLAKERASASLHLTQTVVGTVHALATQLATIANDAFDLTDSVETLVSRTGRVMRELHYVQTEAENGTLDTAAARLLSRQLRDIAGALDLQVEVADETDMQSMRDQGLEERRDVEDHRREREDRRRHDEDERRDREDEG